MWQTLTQMYGSGFLAAYGENDAPPAVWRGALSKLTREQAKQGIATLAKQGRSYPPNLTEVLEACRPNKPVRYLGGPSSMARPALPRPKARPEIVKQHVEHMKTLFAKSIPQTRLKPLEQPACTCKSAGECETCRSFGELMGREV